MDELNKAPPSMLRFEGTPGEIGGQIWARMCHPAVCAAGARPKTELAQLYGGILSACLGSMAADFGHTASLAMLRQLVDAFEDMADELGPATEH